MKICLPKSLTIVENVDDEQKIVIDKSFSEQQNLNNDNNNIFEELFRNI